MTSDQVTWEQVEEVARLAFNVWIGQPEVSWAKCAWAVLAEGGMTQFESELKRHLVLLRFLALCSIYRDFCSVAWEEVTEPGQEIEDWADALNFSGFVLGRLYDRLPTCETSDDEVMSDAIALLVEGERRRVVQCLLSAFGGTTGLYESLWRSKNTRNEEARPDRETHEEIARELIIPGIREGSDPWLPLTVSREKGLAWVDQGCPTVELSEWWSSTGND